MIFISDRVEFSSVFGELTKAEREREQHIWTLQTTNTEKPRLLAAMSSKVWKNILVNLVFLSFCLLASDVTRLLLYLDFSSPNLCCLPVGSPGVLSLLIRLCSAPPPHTWFVWLFLNRFLPLHWLLGMNQYCFLFGVWCLILVLVCCTARLVC